MLSYPAHIKKQDDAFLVTFPDLENVVTSGTSVEEAIQNAEEALNGCLASDFERNFTIPDPSPLSGEQVHLIAVAPHVAVAIMLRKLRADKYRFSSRLSVIINTRPSPKPKPLII